MTTYIGDTKHRRPCAVHWIAAAALIAALLPLTLPEWASAASGHQQADRPEPGLQGQTMAADHPGSILAQPYSMGVRVIGHDSIQGRDSNVQLSWIDHCAYVSSTGGPFRLIGTIKGDPQFTGIAVIDVSDPHHSKIAKLLRDNGSIAALETMRAVSATDRQVLAAGAYGNGQSGASPNDKPAWLDIYDVSDCASPKLMSEVTWPRDRPPRA